MKTNNDANIVDHDLEGEVNETRIRKCDIISHVPHYTPNIPQQTLPSEQSFSRAPTQLSNIARIDGVKPMYGQLNWIFDLGVKIGYDVSLYNIIEIRYRCRIHHC